MNNFREVIPIFFVAVLLLSSCGEFNRNSERDTNRDQNRNYANLKEKELSKVVGSYFGDLLSEGERIQKVDLTLTVREEVSTQDSDIDSTRIPRLAGYMRLGYILDSGSASHISFSVKNGEYDDKLGLINLELENSQFGILSLELTNSSGKVSGKWLSQENSAGGAIFLDKLTENNVELTSEFTSTSLDSEFIGYHGRDNSNSYHISKVVFQTQKRDSDSILISASLILYNGELDSEYQKFTFSQVSFNVLTGAISMIDDSSTISLSGFLRSNTFIGDWSSTYTGNIGLFSLNAKSPDIPESSINQEPSVSKTYFGLLNYVDNAGVDFPERISLNLSMSEDMEAPFQYSISGKVRFYIGSYGSQEYIEVPFSEVSYNTFTRVIVIRTEEPYQMTFSAHLKHGELLGHLNYGSLGKIADFTLKGENQEIPATNMQGEYQGVFLTETSNVYQFGNLQLFTSYDEGIKIRASLKLIFGPRHSSEYLTYQFSSVDFNPESSELTASSLDSEIYIKAVYHNGSLNGDWFSRTVGRLGKVRIEKKDFPMPPGSYTLLTGIGGTYKGKITDSNENTNLPEKTILSIIVSRDISAEDGISIDGSLRLYMGDFESQEYVEFELDDVRHNFYTGEFNAATRESGLSIRGILKSGALSGVISHDGFGKIGKIEVIRR